MAALLIAGAALSLYGSYKSSQAQADGMEAQAFADRMKAKEILDRNKLNIESLYKNAGKFQESQVTAITGSGGGMGASAMALVEETMTLATEEATRMSREAEWEAKAVRAGAASTESAAGATRQAGTISAFGSALSMGYKANKAGFFDKAPDTKIG